MPSIKRWMRLPRALPYRERSWQSGGDLKGAIVTIDPVCNGGSIEAGVQAEALERRLAHHVEDGVERDVINPAITFPLTGISICEGGGVNLGAWICREGWMRWTAATRRCREWGEASGSGRSGR